MLKYEENSQFWINMTFIYIALGSLWKLQEKMFSRVQKIIPGKKYVVSIFNISMFILLVTML